LINRERFRLSVATANYQSPDAHLSQTLDLEAKSYIIYDLNNQKIVRAENATSTFALASLSKVIIIGAYLDYKKLHNETIDTDGYAYIEKILVESDNEAIEDLNKRFEEKNGMSLMILAMQLADKLGFPNEFKFTNPSGLDIDEVQASNFGTPRAVATVYSYLYKNYPEVFQKTKFNKSVSGGETLINTNHTIEETFGILSSKTGYTDVAGGNLAVTVTPAPGSEFLLIVFGSSKEGRFKDIQKLNTILPVILKIQ
jgi:D-alanyl-D-alanine carboxypeptidase